VPPLRRFFTIRSNRTASEAAAPPKTVAVEATPSVLDAAVVREFSPRPQDLKARGAAGCSACAEKRRKLDSRHLVLGGTLLSTVIFGFPVFCIVCPVGLTFASLIALWRLVGFNEPSWALLVFPLFLAFELLVLRKWCLKFCPLGALMSLMSIPNRLLRPEVDTKKCLREQGIDCSVCVSVCEEQLDPHFPGGMHECTKCGLCKERRPAKAITIPVFAVRPKKKEELQE
jgi:ferredoxin-type protein NapH